MLRILLMPIMEKPNMDKDKKENRLDKTKQAKTGTDSYEVLES